MAGGGGECIAVESVFFQHNNSVLGLLCQAIQSIIVCLSLYIMVLMWSFTVWLFFSFQFFWRPFLLKICQIPLSFQSTCVTNRVLSSEVLRQGDRRRSKRDSKMFWFRFLKAIDVFLLCVWLLMDEPHSYHSSILQYASIFFRSDFSGVIVKPSQLQAESKAETSTNKAGWPPSAF